jgi:hypothetical protein
VNNYIEVLANYDSLIEGNTNIVRKGKTMPYTSINGHMSSFLSKEGQMGLRLSIADLETFMKEFKTKKMEQHGRLMKEFVLVPDQVLADVKLLSNYFEKSVDYVSTLKPKATKKK